MYVIASADEDFTQTCETSLPGSADLYPGHVRDYDTLMMLLKKPQPNINVLLLDATLLPQDGVNQINNFLSLRPEMHILYFVEVADQREEISAILFGVKAYCTKSMDFQLLGKIITAVLKEEIWVDRLFVTRLLAEIQDISEAKQQEAHSLDFNLKDLTKRENEIAELVANGATNRVIAEKLKITERTVKAHLGTIFKKMNVKDRLQLAISLNRHHQIPAIWHGMLEDNKAESKKK